MARECPSLEGLMAQSQTREISNSIGRFTAGARRQIGSKAPRTEWKPWWSTGQGEPWKEVGSPISP